MAARIGARHALGRHAPGPGARARRRARRALGPGRGDHRRGPVPRRHDRRRRTCAGSSRPGSSRRSSTSSATRPRAPAATSRPVSIGPRELADVLLPPFEMAVREGGARSVMNAYTDIDGVPVGRRRRRCSPGCCATPGASTAPSSPTTSRSRSSSMLHGVAATWGEAAAAALTAGIDVELPTVHTFGEPLLEAVARRARSTRPSSTARCGGCCARRPSSACSTPTGRPCRPRSPGRDLGDPEALRGTVDLDPPANRALAREIAEQAVVLLRNDGVLPLAGARAAIARDRPERRRPVRHARLLLVPRAHRRAASRRAHRHRAARPCSTRCAPSSPTRRSARARHHDRRRRDRRHRRRRRSWRRAADVVVLALGDRAGLFGRGTSGEGCDVESLDLPGAQQRLLDAVLDAGTPVVRHPARRPAVRPRRGRDRRGRASCRRSSRARRAPARSRAC